MSQPPITPRTYPAPWKGFLILACRKCQKKLRRTSPRADTANIKKALKRRTGKGVFHVLSVPCLKLCPKDAVTVCTQHQLAQGECSIIRTPQDLDTICRLAATPPPPPQA